MTDILLQTLSGQDIQWLQTTGKLTQIKAGEILINPQRPIDAFYLLLDGKLSVMPSQVEHSARKQMTQNLTDIFSGEMLGILAPHDGLDQGQSITAIDDALLLVVPQATMQQKLQDDSQFAAHLYHANARLLGRRTKSLMQQLNAEAIATYQPEQEFVTVFSGLEDRDLDWLITVGAVQSIAANADLIQSAQPVDAIHILLDGVLSAGLVNEPRSTLVSAFASPQPKQRPHADRESSRLSPGALVGETALLTQNFLNMTVTAVRESKVLSIPRWRLAAKLLHDIEFASRFYRVLAIILAHQQKSLRQYFGLGQHQNNDFNESEDAVLSQADLAEARFEWMLKRIQTELGTGREIQW
jgi:CRP-like cAMP-binding protein